MKHGNSSPQRRVFANKDERKASQGYVDVKRQTTEQLEELIERQNKLLQNRFFIAKLPDKGQKIILFKTELEEELKKRQDSYDSTCQLLSNLAIGSEDIEWNKGDVSKSHQSQTDNDHTSASEVDPLTLIATHSGTATGIRTKVNGESSSSVEKDLNLIKEPLYVSKVCEKYGKAVKVSERFKPNQLKDKNDNAFSISTENLRKKLGDKWEVTEATPPVYLLKSTQIISLSESLRLQKEQVEKLKEIEKKNAVERLIRNKDIKMGDKLSIKNITEYRSSGNSFDESAEDEENDSDDLHSEEED